MIPRYYTVLGAWDNFTAVWSLCESVEDYHNAYLAAGQVAIENDEFGFYVSEFVSTRTVVGITVFHWHEITPMETLLLKHSFDQYLDDLQSRGIDLDFDETLD